jgi:hypothetical protein
MSKDYSSIGGDRAYADTSASSSQDVRGINKNEYLHKVISDLHTQLSVELT